MIRRRNSNASCRQSPEEVWQGGEDGEAGFAVR
jgi:hypothetical protein